MGLGIMFFVVICVLVGGCAGWAGKQVDTAIGKVTSQVTELEKRLAALEAKIKG